MARSDHATSRARKFAGDFDRTRGLEEAGALAKKSKANALSRLFLRAMHFVSETQAANLRVGGRESVEIKRATNETLSGTQIETLQLLMDSEASAESLPPLSAFFGGHVEARKVEAERKHKDPLGRRDAEAHEVLTNLLGNRDQTGGDACERPLNRREDG